MTNRLSTKSKWLLLAILLLLFAAAKIGGLWWWHSRQNPSGHTPVLLAPCAVAQGCRLANSAVVSFVPPSDEHTPFDIRIRQLPAGTGQVYVQFSMVGMDMGFNRFHLTAQADGSWLATGVRLPLCIEQRADYRAEIHIDGQTHILPFTLPHNRAH